MYTRTHAYDDIHEIRPATLDSDRVIKDKKIFVAMDTSFTMELNEQ
jgi:hypothetical protein